MADDLNVKFGADVSALNAAVAQARQNLAAFAPGATAAAKASLDGLNASLAQTRAVAGDLSFGTAQAAMDEARASTALLTDTLVDANAAAREMKTTWATVAFNTAAFGGIIAGAAALRDYAISIGYAQRGTALFTQENEGALAAFGRWAIAAREQSDVFGRIGRAVSDAANNVRLYFLSSLDDTEIKAIAAAGALGSFDAVLARSGMSSKQFLVEETKKLEAIPSLTDEAATSIITMMATMPAYSVEAQDVLTQFLQTFAKTGDEAVKFTKTMTDAFRDPVHGGEILGDLAKQVENVEGQLKLAAVYAKQIAPDQAVAMYDRIEQKLKDSRGLIAQQDADKRRVLSTLILENGEEEGAARLIREQLDLDQQRTRQLDQQLVRLENARQAWAGIVEEAKKQAAYVEAIGKASTPTSRIDDLEETKKALAGNSRRERDDDITPAEKDAAIRVAILEAANQTDEGLLGVLNVMSNRLHAAYGNYGDTLGQVVSKPGAFSAYDPDKMKAIDPNGLQYRRTAGLYDKTFGDDPTDDPTGGATHYYRADQVNPAWGTGMGNRKKIGDHTFGNPDGPPVPSDDQSKIAGEAVAQANTQLREQNALLAGGTEAEKLQAAQAQENLALSGREVDNAADLVEVRKKAVDAAKDGTPQEQVAAQTALTAAEKAYADAEEARIHATAEAQTAAARDGSQERQALELAEINRQQATYAEGSAKYEEFEKQKTELTQRYAKQTAADAAEVENVRFDAIQRGFKEEQEQIKENGRLKVTTAEQTESATIASLQRQAAAEREHYQIQQRNYADQPQQYRKQTQELEQVDARSHQLRQAAERSYQQEVGQMYRQTFEQIGSNISTSIMGLIQGTTTFKGAMQSLARELVSSFISSRVKMVADWAAGQAANVTTTAAGQSAQTAATAAGEAARTTIVGAGAAAQSATKATSIIGSILASANETIAGVFGFLSPILGPAAAGPAAAAGATVASYAALPSFAVGAWSLPSDMVANVHAGEMIVPAGPAAMMRAAAGGGAGVSTGGGGDTHNWNISAWDGASVSSWLNNGGARQIAKAVGAHQKLNPSTR